MLLAGSGPHAVPEHRADAPAPILVVADPADPFGRYYAEILRAEGLNEVDVTTDLATLDGRQAVVLADRDIGDADAARLQDWVQAGGDLVAMRPPPQLAGLLGLGAQAGTLADAYVKVDTTRPPGAGIVADTIQFHGAADRWTLAGATPVATLYSTAADATTDPAVTVHGVGAGTAAAFTYDLARSVVYTRQGNPAWAGQERDMDPDNVIRSDDMFFGAKPGDVQPDWVDFSKIAIPQADEQQRLLANLLTDATASHLPLPRFWYLPRGLKAAVVMTGDDHGTGGTRGRFAQLSAADTADCTVADWTCPRMTSYVYPGTPITDAEAAGYQAQGFELALHLTTNCHNFTPASLEANWAAQLPQFATQWPSLTAPVSNRTHCIAWSDWAGEAKAEAAHGVRLDANYYYWPAAWVQDRPGLFTGSGLPMRFADTDGSVIDVYQATTQITDESGMTIATHIATLLDDALGPQGYYAAVTVNMHTDTANHAGANAIVAAAAARGVPVISARQLLDWLNRRDAATFTGVAYAAGTLRFTIATPNGAGGLQAMLPADGPEGPLLGVTRDGAEVATSPRSVKGIAYAVFDAAPGAYEATYELPPSPTPTPTPTPTETPAATATSTPEPTVIPQATAVPTPSPEPAARFALAPARVRASSTGVVKLRATCSPCARRRVRVALRVGTRNVASHAFTLSGAASVKLTLDRTTRRRLARSRSLAATAVVTADGQPPVRATIRLLAPGRG